MPNYNTTLQTNNSSLEEIITQLNNMPDAGGEQATPVISVNNSNGLITATAGTKSSTYQMAFKAAQTITPTTTNQTIAANTYLGGVQTIKGDANLVASNIVSGKSIFGVVGTATTGGGDPFAIPFTYTVNPITGASYGFAVNSNGYYESQNKGVNDSYAICRVKLTVTNACNVVFDVINFAEGNWDYALFGYLDTPLTLSSSADTRVKYNFKGQQSADIVNVTYSNVTAGSHYIDIKFIKDSSSSYNNDSVQFQIQSPLPKETINKILAADSDLISENIKSGVDIFGVVGNYEGSGGSGDTSVEDSLITRTISGAYTNDRVTYISNSVFARCTNLTSVSFPVVTSIGSSAFCDCTNLTSVSFPVVTSMGKDAFLYCTSLTSVSFPKLTYIGSSVFAYCANLTSVSFPVVTSIGSNAFYSCTNLTSVSFPKVKCIGSYAFCDCTKLSTIYLTESSVCTLSNSNAFKDTGIWSTKGSIFVPSSLVASYKAATNWAYFKSRIYAYFATGSGGSNN